MVRGEVKVANDLFTTSRQGHIFNLISSISVRDFVLLPLFLSSSLFLSLLSGIVGDSETNLSNPRSLHTLAVTVTATPSLFSLEIKRIDCGPLAMQKKKKCK